MPAKKFTAVGVYTSAGGFSEGMKRGGANLIAHLHDGEFGYESLQLNFPRVPTFTDYEEDWPLDRLRVEEPDVMFCAPPCAPWSMSGGRGQNVEADPRAAKVGHALQAGFRVRPKVWVMESVVNFTKGTEFLEKMVAAWNSHGYQVTHFFSNYLLHGIPQNRNRYHFIAHRVPLAGPRAVLGAFPSKLPVVSDVLPPAKQLASELITDNTFKKFAPIIADHVPPGHRLRKVYRALAGLQDGEPGGPSFNYYRLRSDYPASTMLGKPRIIHPNGKRLLNVREGKALAGYPEAYKLAGKTEEKKYNELGKGALPPMGEFLARWFAASFAIEKPRLRALLQDHSGEETVDWRPVAQALLRQRAKAIPFPKEKVNSMRELRDWRREENRDDDDEAEDD
jgi:site-specific DNA-cytosine methylase